MTTRKPYLSVEELAELLNLTRRQAQRLAVSIKGATRLGKGRRSPWVLPIESVDQLIAERNAKNKRPSPRKGKGR
jgi:hypothetical protein